MGLCFVSDRAAGAPGPLRFWPSVSVELALGAIASAEPVLSPMASSLPHPSFPEPAESTGGQGRAFTPGAVREIAHDLNNALATVLGYAQLLEGQPDLPPHLMRQVQVLLAEARRAAQNTESLLELAHSSSAEAVSAASLTPSAWGAPSEFGADSVAVVASREAPLSSQATVAPRGASILVVDDEEPVITLIAEVLAFDGHEVTPAFNGAEALAWTQMRSFDLIISDVRMPAVGGPAFFEILQTERPDLLNRVLFVTGDTLSQSTRQFLQAADRPVLAKPFDPDRLRDVVTRCLQSGS
jgi:CheY-like chemotaxis protein